jgi:membrane-bound lytic murein transglycosylase B
MARSTTPPMAGKLVRRSALAALLLMAFAGTAHALERSQYPELGDFIQYMVVKHDMHAADLGALFARVEIKPDIITAMETQKEGLPWYEYRKLFVTDESVRLGVKFWKTNDTALQRAASEYGVDPAIVVAIIGVETRYGKNVGGYRVLDALTTLTLKSANRADFFRGELEEFLLLTQELGVDALSIKGSYAGAMGVPQFMPSSYRRYAVDFDGDHKRNLLTSTADAIGSVANYFKLHGWLKSEAVTDEVKLEGSLYSWLENTGNEPTLSVSQLRKYGIVPIEGIDLKQLATLITLEGENGPMHRLGYNNFYVITRYNRSKRYAMAVYELSRQLHQHYYETPP